LATKQASDRLGKYLVVELQQFAPREKQALLFCKKKQKTFLHRRAQGLAACIDVQKFLSIFLKKEYPYLR
jgi:hypothetical protein